jgi:prolipoprotein diacylglyceryltransferase
VHLIANLFDESPDGDWRRISQCAINPELRNGLDQRDLVVWNVGLAAALVWFGRHLRIRPPGLFALYVAGYCTFRIVEELLRVDPAAHVLGVRWNLLLSVAGTLIGLAWFARIQTGRPIRRHAAAQ